jgi:hypothetical protein
VLALNCLVSAYMMSALYLRGLKQGDTQMTATGLVIAALFFFLSQVRSCWLVGCRNVLWRGSSGASSECYIIAPS